MKFKTQNSTYELDVENRRIRRVEEEKGHSDRMGAGEWKEYRSIGPLQVGWCAWVKWPDTVPLLTDSPRGSVPFTRTSPITEIIEDE